MGTFEYLLLLAVVILGLAICDLAISLHRLLVARSRVHWDWLAPLAALVVFLKIVTQWWAWHGAEGVAQKLTFEAFLVVLAGATLLFLLAAQALPDETEAHVIDLRVHYEQVSRTFWSLFALHFLVINALTIWAETAAAGSGGAHLRFSAGSIAILAAVPIVAISLVFIRNRVWHGVCLAGFVAIYLLQSFGHGLS